MNLTKSGGWSDIDASKFREFDNHKLVKRFEDKKSGLIGFVAIHNNNLGPAVGGTRMFPYKSENDAIADALRLSRAMTYKCALAGVRFGGGKAVIVGNPINKNKELLKSYAQKIKDLEGELHTGEDVGITEDDVQLMLKTCPYFIGKRGFAGDPSPFAALSVFHTMQTAVSEVFDTKDISDMKVAIKGVGKVGCELLRLLLSKGTEVIVADINTSLINSLKKKFPQIKIVSSEEIYSQEVDILSPCALGGDLNNETIQNIKAKIICGGANNQLSSVETGNKIFSKGVIYIPDYLANAGGLINVVDELEEDDYNRKRVLKRIENLKNILHTIFLFSKQKNQSLDRVADKLAEDVFNGKSSL